MKHLFTLLLSLTLLSWGAAAQMLPYHSGRKLTWDDFEIRDSSEALPSQLNIHWNVEKRKTRVGDLPIRYSVYTAEPRKDLSWVREDCRTPEELALNQTLFEMAESYANAMTDSVLFSRGKNDHVVKFLYQQYAQAAKTLRETGTATFPYPDEQAWDLSDLDWKRPAKGIFVGAGVTEDFMLGPAKDLIAPSKGLQVFAGRFFGKNAVMLEAEWGHSKNLLRYSNWQGVSRDKTVPYFSMSAKYLRPLPRLGHLQVSPFAGLGYSKRGLIDMYYGTEVIQGATLSEGVSLEYYPFRTLKLRGGGPRYTEFGVALKVYSDQVWLAQTKTLMPSLNFMLGFILPTGLIDRPALKH